MAPAGTQDFKTDIHSIRKLAKQLTVVGFSGEAVAKSRVIKTFERNLEESVKQLNASAAKDDAFLCFELEKVCILFERTFFATTEQDHKRLDKQLSENGAAAFSAKLVFEAEQYKQHVLDIYGPNRKILFPPEGEPCVTIVRKQIQQLARPKTGITSPKIKEFYAARQANLRCALGLCIEAQCKALDIPVPKQGKSKGLEL